MAAPIRYRHERVIGKGAFGCVALSRSVVTGELVAIKTIDRSKLYTDNLRKTVEQEIRVLKRLDHESVVKLLEVLETPRSIQLVMEYADGGNMQQLVNAEKKIAEPRAQPLLWQMLDAVAHCHAHRVCHRDLKLENFVLDKAHRRVKLIDFGLSVVWREGHPLFKAYGTPCYTAPEILGGKQYFGAQVDVWSIGVCLFTMLAGCLPFQAICSKELNRKVLSGRVQFPATLSSEAKDIIREMLTLQPDKRADIPTLRANLWLVGASSAVPDPPPASRRSSPDDLTLGPPSPLDTATLQQLQKLGMESAAVERSVHTQAYDHPAACYAMLRNAAKRRQLLPSSRSALAGAPAA